MTTPTEEFTVYLVEVHDMLHTKTSDIVDDMCRKHYAGDEHSILLRFFSAGDVTTIAWPDPDLDDLRSALYDARESGMIPFVNTVILPDGQPLSICI